MKKYKSFLPALLVLLIIIGGSRCAKAQLVGVWSGSVSMTIRSETMLVWSETNINTTFTDNKGSGTIKNDGGGKLIAGTSSCHGQGVAELHDLYYATDSTYYIYVIGPECLIGPDPKTDHQHDILIADEPIPANRKHLQGTRKTVVKLDNLGSTGTITLTWDLTMSVDVELIVTPEGKDRSGISKNYDSWLPEPGMDETTVGSIMNISLKLQGKNGKPLSLKATAFELRLSNTSQEPGITINFPISPRANQLPDLSFMKQPDAELLEDSQFIKISCPGCVTTNVKVGSYDGGGWTTLTATAILEDSTRIEGELVKPGGEREINIPKRDPGSRIASSWLTAYGVPEDMDDIEKSPENKNNGDGLTAYEEYRGVISFGQFQRLDPIRKELGFLIKRSELELFTDGVTRFSNASHIVPVYFDRYEIPDNRRINQNAKSAHDFDQFVLRIQKGNTGLPDMYGGEIIIAFGIAYGGGNIPAKVTHILIDVDRIHSSYQSYAQAYGVAKLPFTEEDWVASTTAHEIGHGVSLLHHGQEKKPLPGFTEYSNPPRIFNADILLNFNWEVPTRPYTIDGPIGLPGNHESGNVDCFMCYRYKSNWVRVVKNNNDVIYYKTVLLKAGTIFCTDNTGTGINSNNNYFGDAIHGNCLGRIKLRN